VLFLGLGAFLTVNLPALIVTAALCVALPALVWPPVYRFLFLAFWFWAGLDPSRIPSISSTLFAPAGGYAAQGLFAGQGAYAGLANSQLDFGLFAPPPSPMTAVISIALLLTLAAGIVCLGPVLVAVARREN
jgi:hypothetical protein